MFEHRVFGRVLPALLLSAFLALPAKAALIAAYGHENPENRLQDDTNNGHTLTNVNNVAFVTPPEQPGFHYFKLGDTVAQYGGSRHLQVPDEVYPHDGGKGGSFTFTGLVNRPSGGSGFQTILSSSRFRLQLPNYHGRRLHIGLVTNPDASPVTYSQHYTPAGEDVFEFDTWYFVALRYDETSNLLQAFLQDASDEWNPVRLDVASALVPAVFPEFTDLTLGRNISLAGGPDNWNGMIDSARFYTAALSDSELEAVFFQFSVPEPSAFALLLVALCGLLLRRTR